MNDYEKSVYESDDKVFVNDETDWGYIFDDLNEDDWENHMGGPEDDNFES